MISFNSALRSAKYAIIGAALALAPAAASAFTVTPVSSSTIGTTGTAFGLSGVSGTTVGHAWTGTRGGGNKASIIQSFEVDSDVDFTISLAAYEVLDGTGNGTEVNIFSGAPTKGGPGSPFTLLTTFVDGSDVGEEIVTLAPGTYSIRVFEDGTPNSGIATFALAPIPLPAGMALMLGALGGLVVIRRRKSTTA